MNLISIRFHISIIGLAGFKHIKVVVFNNLRAWLAPPAPKNRTGGVKVPKIVMGVMYSLLVGLVATLLVVLLVKMLTIIRVVKSLIMWCIRIKQLRSLPSPPGQWFWGHALLVRTFVF